MPTNGIGLAVLGIDVFAGSVVPAEEAEGAEGVELVALGGVVV